MRLHKTEVDNIRNLYFLQKMCPVDISKKTGIPRNKIVRILRNELYKTKVGCWQKPKERLDVWLTLEKTLVFGIMYELGFSYQAMGDLFGCSVSRVNRIKNDKNKNQFLVKPRLMMELCEKVGDVPKGKYRISIVDRDLVELKLGSYIVKTEDIKRKMAFVSFNDK